MNAHDDYEAWRPALIAFYQSESPYLPTRIQCLRRGCPLSVDDKHTIDGLRAALKVAA